MNNKKDILPMVIAAMVALVVTGLVRWFMPGSSQSATRDHKNEISMPAIPLMAKVEKKKIIEKQVLVTSRSIKKDEKITAGHFTWKKWPEDALQPYFIAKSSDGTPLNNGADYNNALKMWAKTDIPNGIPLVMSMLNPEDPHKKAEEAKKKKEEEAKKKEEKEKAEAFIKKGMRAVTFSIDQKSASASSMLAPGDLVDVLIMEQRADRSRTYKYKAVKILAIDGVTKFEIKKRKTENNNLFNSVTSISNFLAPPRNVTLEIKEELVETMLKQSSATGIVLSIRSQSEPVDNKEDDESTQLGTEKNSNMILDGILSINKTNPTEALIEEKARKEAEENSMSMLMSNISMVNNADSIHEIKNSKHPSSNEKSDKDSKDAGKDATDAGKDGKVNKDGKYEIVSGKIVGEEPKDEPKTVIVYRKLTPTAVQFDDSGKIVDGTSASSRGSRSSSKSSRR